MAETPAFGRSTRTGPRRGERRPADGLWHRPQTLNLIADILTLLASVALGYALLRALLLLPLFELRAVVVVSPLSQVTLAQIEYAARSSLRGSFFSVDLEQARGAFEKLPWVRRAELRRVWPGQVEVRLEEHVAVAYWRAAEAGDTRLVSEHGEIFAAASNAQMPVFSGPEAEVASMLARHQMLTQRLAPLGRSVVGLGLSARLAWQLRLDDGMLIELGRDQPRAPLDQRLVRFVHHYPDLRRQIDGPILVADLRYPSGFALKLAQGLPGSSATRTQVRR